MSRAHRDSIALVDDDPRATYRRQERNGMWVRAALLLLIFGADAAFRERCA